MPPHHSSVFADLRTWRRLLIALGLFLALLQVFRALHGGQTRFITSDGDWYHAYLVSMYFDHDLDLSNQMDTWQRAVGRPPLGIRPGQPTPTAFTVGPAILWLPAFAAADAAVYAVDRAGGRIPRNGYAMPYQLMVALSTLVYDLIGVWLALRTALWWAGEQAGRWPAGPPLAIATTLCATPALYYLIFEPTMSHGLSIFAASLLVCLWVKTGDSSRWRRWASVGIAGGLCALIRPQDGILLLLPLSTLVAFRGAGLVVRASALIIGSAAAFLPQALVWQATFGRPFAVPQGPGFLQWTSPALLQVWFSPHHGLFAWTPVFLIAIIGLMLAPKSTRRLVVAMLIVFLLESYVNSAARDWWAGDAFGARRFLGLFPIFAIGLTTVAIRMSRRPVAFMAIAAVFTIANLALMAAYVTGRIPHG